MAEENPQQIDLPQHEEPQFDWITLHNEMGGTFGMMETNKEKMIRKIKANPFVPVGCLATVMALAYGLWSFRTGKRKMSQYMMRTRIAAQGFTVLALMIGIGMSANKMQPADVNNTPKEAKKDNNSS